MIIDNTKITTKKINNLRETLFNLLEQDKQIDCINTADDIETLSNFLLSFVKKNPTTIKILKETGVGVQERNATDYEELQSYEKAIYNIVIAEQLEHLNNIKPTEKGSARILKYTRAIIGETNGDISYAFKNGIFVYNKLKSVAKRAIQRTYASPKVTELAAVYPDLKIKEALAYGVMTKNISLTQDQLLWFENTIRILLENGVSTK